LHDQVKTRILYLASHNQHKIAEFQQMVGNLFEIRSISNIKPKIEWVEDGNSFQANARIKAHAVRSVIKDTAILADDSGLAVDALKGAPGIYSSRYAGTDGDDQANNSKLLTDLSKTPASKRSAAFVCCLIFLDEKGNEQVFEGYCHGSIAEQATGNSGFGYDPIFIPRQHQESLAVLGQEIKNKISHRSSAVSMWLKALQ
jgi:XTP/dITP diphosphohydrolase